MSRVFLGLLVAASLILGGVASAAPCDPTFATAEDCWPGTGKRAGDHRGRFAGFDVVVDDKLPRKVATFVLTRIGKVLARAYAKDDVAAGYLKNLDKVEVAASSTGNRFVGWRRGKGEVMLVSVGSFLDKKAGFLVDSIVRAAREKVSKENPLVERVGNLRLEGSPYPDVDNRPFFRDMKRVMEMSKKLPKRLRRYVDALDAIHYVPRSKHFAKTGPGDPAIALYNTRLSEEGARRIFVHRDMKWNSEVGVLLLLVHEGTHAVQHATAGRYEKDLPAQQAALKKLPAGTPERGDLKQRIDRMKGYLSTWNGNKKDKRGISKRMRFECEATVNEIKAAKALGVSPDLVDDSLYIQHCDKAGALIAQWRDQRLKEGLRKANGG